MEWIILIIGILIGSFLNVCIYRIPNNQSVSYPPSSCSNCNTRIKYYDLIPIVSYILLGGRCRSCGEKISLRYPSIEGLNGILYFLLYNTYGFSLSTLFFMPIVSILIVITFIDYDHMIIPYRLNIMLGILGIINILLGMYPVTAKSSLIGAVLGFGFFFLIAIVTGGQMGGGDIFLMGVLGLILGLGEILMVTVLSFITGAVISVILLLTKIKGRKDPIPFGPFIALSAVLVILFGNDILYFYYKILL
jgi:leader peptidase (prepilin peptidase)/N-methyltransferase